MIATFLINNWRLIGVGLVITLIGGIIATQHLEVSHYKSKLATTEANYSALENSYEEYKNTIAAGQAIVNSRLQSEQAALKTQAPIRIAKNKSAVSVVAKIAPKSIKPCPELDDLINGAIQ